MFFVFFLIWGEAFSRIWMYNLQTLLWCPKIVVLDLQCFLEGGVGKLIFPIVNISFSLKNYVAFITKEIIIFFKTNEQGSLLTPWLIVNHLCDWTVLTRILAGQRCLSTMWPNANDQACSPSPSPPCPLQEGQFLSYSTSLCISSSLSSRNQRLRGWQPYPVSIYLNTFSQYMELR